MPNPRFIQTAERWKNPETPSEKVKQAEQRRTPTAAVPDYDYFFLGDDLGRETHEAITRKYGAENPFVTKDVSYDSDSKLVKGSKPGYIIAVNEILGDRNLRTATSYDVQKAIDEGKINQSRIYEDIGLVLYSESGENEYLARDLAAQVRKRNGRVEFPTLISLVELGLKVDKNAPNGMAFNLTNDNQIVQAQQLSNANDQKRFSKLNEFGLPIFEDSGKHTFYSGNSGLRMLIRDRDSDLDARYWYLVYSDADGRVLVVREAARSSSGGTR